MPADVGIRDTNKVCSVSHLGEMPRYTLSRKQKIPLFDEGSWLFGQL